MNEKKQESFSDIVDRATEELRSIAIPSGPPPELLEALLVGCVQRPADENVGCVQRTLKTSAQTSPDASYIQPLSRLHKLRNIIMKNPFKSLTTFAACCLVLIAAYLLVGPMFHGDVAFAEFSEIIQKAKSMVCKCRTIMPMPDNMNGKITVNMKMMTLEPGRTRNEINTQFGADAESNKSPQVMIMDVQAGKSLSFDPTTKTAHLINIKGQANYGNPQNDWLTMFKNMVQSSKAENLGQKTIDGKQANGFRYNDENKTVTFWTDIDSGLPIKAEIQMKLSNIKAMNSIGVKTMDMVLSDFQFDVPLDESLFSLTPPEGYKLQEMNMDVSDASEKDVIDALRILADMEDGAFPDTLDGMTLAVKVSSNLGKMSALDRQKNKTPNGEMSAEMRNKMTEIGSIVRKLSIYMEKNPGWKYAGKGVKLGDAQTPIFWYVPKDSKQGRVIYGDLSVRDVPIDKFPPDPMEIQNKNK
jgi:outer membrane lipoprotein-sorting protein